jgi:hypothetical protein
MRNTLLLGALQLFVAAGCGPNALQDEATAPADSIGDARASSAHTNSLAQAGPRLQPRAAAAKHTGRELPANTYVERFVVKFHEGSHVRLRGNRVVPLAAERSPAERALLAARGLDDARLEASVRAAQALLERAPRTGGVSRLFREDEASLEARRASGEARSGRELADLNLYFEVPLLLGTTAGTMAGLVASLNALEGVEVAYAQPPPAVALVDSNSEPGDPRPVTPLFENQQGYLNAAPVGIDARFAWGLPGGNGANVRVVDVEFAWRTTHEDLPALFVHGGTQSSRLDHRNHGTAVLGEIVGVRNGHGVTGIAHGARAGVQGINDGNSVAHHISSAVAQVGRGDIVLVELQATGPDDGSPCTCNVAQCHSVPMEYWPAEFDTITTATANGVVVVEAAGNGSVNLDASVYGDRFNRAVRDSGAILVGASEANTRAPACFTNFGGRVDLHGWGASVTTLGYDPYFVDSSEDQAYTFTFGGTSSAAPIVTGAVASLQGAALAARRAVLDPRMVRSLLAGTGTPQAAAQHHIGPMPNLRNAHSTNPIDVSDAFVGQLYVDVLRRAPDAAGFAHNSNTLRGCNGDAACLASRRVAMARFFLESAENRQQDPDLNPASSGYNAAFITHCYTNFLRRQPDAGGFSWWLNALNAGGDYNGVVSGFINSSEYRARFGAQ